MATKRVKTVLRPRWWACIKGTVIFWDTTEEMLEILPPEMRSGRHWVEFHATGGTVTVGVVLVMHGEVHKVIWY